MNDVYLGLFYDFLFYAGLTWYLDNVLPGEYGTRRNPLFFLQPSYWLGSYWKKKKKAPKKKAPSDNGDGNGNGNDSKVHPNEVFIQSICPPPPQRRVVLIQTFVHMYISIKDEGLRVDSDVVRERDMVLNNQVPPTTAVTVENLRYLLFSFYLFLSFFQISFESLSSSSSYLVGYCYYNII